MRCEKKITSEDADGYTCYDPCGGELVYLMSGVDKNMIVEPGGAGKLFPKHLYKCSQCGDIIVKL